MYFQHVNVEHNIHDETLDSIADIVQDSGQASPAVRSTPHPTGDQASEMDQDIPAEPEGAAAAGNRDSPNIGAVTRTLAPGDFITIEMNNGSHHVTDESVPSTPPSGGTDPGTYKLVHYKEPEPNAKRKRLKLDPSKAEQLGTSEYVKLDTRKLSQALKELPKADEQGVVELTNGDVRPAEVNVTMATDNGPVARQLVGPSSDAMVNGNAHDQDDLVDSSTGQSPADSNNNLQFNNINGGQDPNSVERISDQNEMSSDVNLDSISTDPSNLHRLKLVDGAHEHKDKATAKSASKRKQEKRAELGDTDIVSITVPPGKPAQDPPSTENTEDDPRQQILLISKSTVRHPSNGASKDGANNVVRSWGSGSVTESDMQVVGIQPLLKEPVQKCKFHNAFQLSTESAD